jgi:glycerol kinase
MISGVLSPKLKDNNFMSKPHILSIDQGTTGTTVVILDSELHPVAKGYTEFPAEYPQDGWMEQEPEDIWNSTLSSIKKALEISQIKPNSIIAIGITNQRETTILWDRQTIEPVAPAIVWQCRRTAAICDDLRNQNLGELYHKKTGLLIDPYFSGTKIKWLLDHYELHPRASSGDLAFGTVDSFLLAKLTDGLVHATDHTNGSRTLLMDINTLKWDDQLLEPLGIPRILLPKLKSSSDLFGYTKNVPTLPDGIPITGIIGDQQAALFGQGALNAGQAKCTYGTGAFMMLNMGDKINLSSDGLITTVAWTQNNKPTYALEGSAFIAGAAVQWLRDGLKLIKTASEIEWLASQVADSGGLFFVPALSGLGAPYWRPEARGLFWGITRSTTASHMAKAVLDGIALQNLSIFKLMEKNANITINSLNVDGGAAANDILMQFQADILEKEIIRPVNLETTAFGAGAMAALGVNYISSNKELRKAIKIDRKFIPKMDKETVIFYTNHWEKIVKKA